MIYEETMAHPETRKLINRFIRKLPKTDVYKNRLHQELVLIIKKKDICFARFLNDKRETMPDVDMNFLYNMRENVFNRLHQKYPNMIARISNHLYYKEKYTTRQVMIEKNGKSTFVPKNKCKIKYFPELKK
jgi:hypothetical protein